MRKKETLAYIAGLIDGEGYIGIKKSKRRDSINPIYHERIQVRMIHEGSISLLTRTLGGNYYKEKPRSHKGRPLYCWQASDALACHILTTVSPFLIIKKQNAKTVLKLRASKNNPRAQRRGSPARRPMLPSIIAHRETLYLSCKRLNHS